ncbi:MAG: hypothetical protein ABEH66_05625 [Halobacteriales archaeon]
MSDSRLTGGDAGSRGDDGGLSDGEVVRILGIANGHVEDAENVLWNATKEADDDELAAALEELTRDVWDLQHDLESLRRRLE